MATAEEGDQKHLERRDLENVDIRIQHTGTGGGRWKRQHRTELKTEKSGLWLYRVAKKLAHFFVRLNFIRLNFVKH